MTPELMAVALVGSHFVCDYPLQGDFLARAKNRFNPVPGFPWWHALGAHAAIHGAAVALITGIWWLFLAEAVAHFIIDDAKCAGLININQDQWLHLAFKATWISLVMVLA